MTLSIALIGASGYTGAVLIELLSRHDDVTIQTATADTSAGKNWQQVLPSLSTLALPPLTTLESLHWQDYDFAFFCLPHGTSAPLIKKALPHCRVIDLGADFRLKDLAVYEAIYGSHGGGELLEQSIYGLSEWHRKDIQSANLVANPGCYATTISLALKPLVRESRLEGRIIMDAKSGISGAGRKAERALLYTERASSLKAYKVGNHRHLPEIKQELDDDNLSLVFVPHLVPMSRGILATIYVTPKKGESITSLRQSLQDAYENEPFVHLADEHQLPETSWVSGSNHCFIGLAQADETIVLVSVIDNLLKGASGQAVQNMNIMAGLPEITALPKAASFP